MKSVAIFSLCLLIVCGGAHFAQACGFEDDLIPVDVTGPLDIMMTQKPKTFTGYIRAHGGKIQLDCSLNADARKLIETLVFPVRVQVKGKLEFRTRAIRNDNGALKMEDTAPFPVIIVDSLKILGSANPPGWKLRK